MNKRLGKQATAEGGDIQSLYMDDGYFFSALDPVETSVYNDTIDFEIRMTGRSTGNHWKNGYYGQ